MLYASFTKRSILFQNMWVFCFKPNKTGRKSLHVLLKLFYFTLSTALFLLKQENTGSSWTQLLKHILRSFVDKTVLLLQLKTWFGYVAERNLENKIICTTFFFAWLSYVHPQMHKPRTLPPEFHLILLAVVSCPPLEVTYCRRAIASMLHKLPFHIPLKILFYQQK